MINTEAKSYLGGEGLVNFTTLGSLREVREGTPGRNLNTGTEAEAILPLTGLLHVACSVTLYNPGTPA